MQPERKTRELVRDLLGDGATPAEVARTLGISRSTVTYHKRTLGLVVNRSAGKRYDWASIRTYYQTHSKRDCMKRFGFSTAAWADAVVRGDIVPRSHVMPISELLGRVKRGRYHVKGRLISAGLKMNACEECGLSEWRDEPLSLELHHVNGDGLDNRLENLQILCPNCHSQTPTWGGRNRRSEQAA